jgi:2-haloacid dehalogenase
VGTPVSVDAVIFDLFGTLLEITSLRALAGTLVGEKNADELVARWRDKQIAYSFAATLMNRYEDFDAITARALDYVLPLLKIEADAEMRRKLCDGWLEMRPYPDATLTLEALRSRGVRTATLTNGTLATAKRALANSGLDSLLNDVWSVDEVRKFKPAPDVYAFACERLKAPPARIGFVSSNGWDATGAAAFGFRVAWCNRIGLPAETMPPAPAHIVTSLQEVVAIFGD